MSSVWQKLDRSGQVILPGDVCVYNGELVVYEKEAWGGSHSRGEFGRFITSDGLRSVKYTSVIFAFDPMSERRNESPELKVLIKKFYEGVKR